MVLIIRTDTEEERDHYVESDQKGEWDKLRKMLNEIPRGIHPLSAEEARNLANFKHKPRAFAKDEAWQNCADAMNQHDAELCKGYREEIDTLLVFAGLFSAVVTGFTVESYQWLQDDPNDAVIALLLQIGRSASANGTAPAMAQRSSGMAPSVALRINIYWFLSLCLSLGTALVAILGKQWVREFERHGALSPREIVGVRQLKLEGLEFWKVGHIISALPLLLQISLGLFALGVLDLLWHLHLAVAIAVCAPTLIVLLFYLATTVLPVMQYSRRWKDNPQVPQCAYKSPQAFLALQVYRVTYAAVSWAWDFCGLPPLSLSRCLAVFRMGRDNDSYPQIDDQLVWGTVDSWNRWDFGFQQSDLYCAPPGVPSSDFRGLRWLCDYMHQSGVLDAVWNCLWDEANSAAVPPHATRFPRSAADKDERLRMSVIHVSGSEPWLLEDFSHASPQICALLSLPRTKLSPEFISECTVRTFLPETDLSNARLLFHRLKGTLSSDPDIVTSLVTAISAWCEQHIREPISDMIVRACDAVEDCPDPQTRSALRWCMVTLAMNWFRSRDAGFRREWLSSKYDRIWNTLWEVVDELCGDTEDFIRHPHRLRDLNRVEEVAALLKVLCEFQGLEVAWPLPEPTVEWARDVIWEPPSSMLGPGDESQIAAAPMILELLRISVFGLDKGTGSAGQLPAGQVVKRKASVASEPRESAPKPLCAAPQPDFEAFAAARDLRPETTDDAIRASPLPVPSETAAIALYPEHAGDTFASRRGETSEAALDQVAVPASRGSALSLRPPGTTPVVGAQAAVEPDAETQ